MLGRVNPRLERRCPGGGVNSSTPVFRTAQGLPVDEKCDCILGLGNAIVGFARCNSRGCTSNDTRGHCFALHDPAVDIDVMRRKVVAAIHILG